MVLVSLSLQEMSASPYNVPKVMETGTCVSKWMSADSCCQRALSVVKTRKALFNWSHLPVRHVLIRIHDNS